MKFVGSFFRLPAVSSGLILMAILAFAPLALSAFAQQAQPVAPATAPAHSLTNPASNPSASETPKAEESQEHAFLNAPVVHKLAHAFNLSEPAARQIFLAINFIIIFLAIVIPLTRIMPRVMRQRHHTLSQSLEEARKAAEEARKRMSVVEAKLAGLDQEIATFRAQLDQESRADEERIRASIKEESERILASAEQEISAASAHAKRALRSFAADLAIEQAGKQLELTPEIDHALIEQFIGQVAADSSAHDGGKK